MIKRLPADKYNIAWFKLADFVSRGEKERALALYRLLVHSLQDEALALQLEGDIFLSFGDPKAIEAYQKAARVFNDNNRIAEAATLYEHIFALAPENISLLETLIDLYLQLAHKAKLTQYGSLLLKFYVNEGRFVDVDELLPRLEQSLPEKLQGQLYEEIVLSYVRLPAKRQHLADTIFMNYLESALQCYLVSDASQLQTFLTRLDAIDQKYADKARSLLAR